MRLQQITQELVSRRNYLAAQVTLLETAIERIEDAGDRRELRVMRNNMVDECNIIGRMLNDQED